MSASQLIQSLARERRHEQLPTMLPQFDTLLGGGLPRGRMTELAARGATGRFAIVIAALAAATSVGEAAVLVDLGDHFDPQMAQAAGVDLRRLLWIRPATLKQAVMSAEMITAAGFQLVVLDAGLHPVRGKRVADAAWVRLARSAEAHGTAMLISTPYPITATASEAVIVARRGRGMWDGRGAATRLLTGVTLELTLEKHRHLRPGRQTSMQLQPLESLAVNHPENRAQAVNPRSDETPAAALSNNGARPARRAIAATARGGW